MGSGRERAGVLFFGCRDHFEILIRSGYRTARSENIPLVLNLVRRQRSDGVHLVHQLMIGRAEIPCRVFNTSNFAPFSKCSTILVESADFSSLADCAMILDSHVVAPGLVLRRLAVLLGESRTKALVPGGIEQMVPNHRPCANKVALAGSPSQRRIKAEAADRIGQAEFGILLEEIRDLVAGEIDDHEVRFGVADFQQIAEKSVASVGTRSSPTNWPPLPSMKRLATRSRS